MSPAKSKANGGDGKDQPTETLSQTKSHPQEQPEARGEPQTSREDQRSSQQQVDVRVDDSGVIAFYANFCRVSSTPEELILDLGLNANPFSTATTVTVSQRIILNHFTAKRLLSALSMAVQRHEQAFGVLETDVRKRVRQT